MLRRTDGERRLTNLLHLGEQIHQAASTHESPDALLRWLATKRRDGAVDEVAQLRLESDRTLVKIITIHKVKGLEFPIVFCPFLWDGNTRYGGPKPEGREYHDTDGAAVFDFRCVDEIGDEEDRIKDAIKLEESAESLRLIYVALTRAVYRCYVIAGTYTTNSFGSPAGGEHESLLNWLVAGGREWLTSVRREALAVEIAAAASLAKRLAPSRLDPLPTNPARQSCCGPARIAHRLPRRDDRAAWHSAASAASQHEKRGAANDHDAHIAKSRKSARHPGYRAGRHPALSARPSAGECLHAISSASTSPIRPAGTTPSPAASRIHNSFPRARGRQSSLLTSMACGC
jgi:exodeoxyribonuclease V beta subunit